MRRQLPDRVKMGALLLPLIGDTSCPWVLDACCGFVDPWMRRIALERGWHLVTCDVAPQTTEVVQVDLNGTLPWCAGQFEAVTCIDTLEHVEDYAHAITELARITRREGVLIFGVPMPGVYPHLRSETRQLAPDDEGHEHRWAFGTDVMVHWVRAGFRQIGGVYSMDDSVFRLNHLWVLEKRS